MRPKKALNIYLEARANEVTEATLQSHEYRLNHLVRWCKQEGIEDVADLDRRDLHEFRVWRREDGDLAPASEKTQMDSVRVFIKHLERLDVVETGLHEAVVSPALSGTDKRSEDIVDHEVAEDIVEHLDKYQYASNRHVAVLLMWRAGLRTGALQSLDLTDYSSDEQYIEVTNRPDTGTRVKNGDGGERHVALSSNVCDVIDDYITDNRHDVLDDHGRQPLVATEFGRVAKPTVRNWSYVVTQPCMMGDCPHDRDEDECRAAHSTDYPGGCPSSVAPHAWRRGSITAMLRSDVPSPIVSDKVDVSESVLDEFYDKRSSREKMEQRRRYADW